MSSISPAGRRTRTRVLGLTAAALAVAVSGALVAPNATAGAVAAAARDGDQHRPLTGSIVTHDAGRYVVVLKAPPAASYDGGNRRFAATRATGRSQFRGDSSAVRAYTNHLRQQQDRVAASVGTTAKDHYTVAVNGFAAELTGRQATELANDKSVLLLTKDTLRKKDTWNSPATLGLTGKRGVWAAKGTRKNAGNGIVVGIIDSGFWPGTGSFRGAPIGARPSTPYDITMDAEGGTRMEKLDGSLFRGQCETGQNFEITDCNSKVIGARYYAEAYLDGTTPADRPDSEFISPRDGSGHGSHTASTAAGQLTAPVSVEGRRFGQISGMAPGSKIAVYKICFENVDPELSGCATSASIAAIDDAVADGVDVINYSISGALDTVLDPVELAFEGAAEAGVFIATSAGNSGPDASTVAHNSPWLTTTAAGTHTNLEGTITLADGTKLGPKLLGASVISSPVARTRVVTAEASVVAGGDAEEAALCAPNTLDPAKVRGKIVVCLRGVYDRVAKSAEVKRAGGKALILANPTPNSLDADFHAVPTIHISDTDGAKLFAFLRKTTAPTALFSPGNKTRKKTPLPQVAGFSSRGPALANDSDLLKPDLTAPGQSVLAAVAPPSNQGRRYDLYSGTSMSSPHIAGLAAFILGEKPRWTPMEIKSAMMTTSSKMKNARGRNETDVFAAGSGQVRPKKFFDPGLFVTETASGWRGYLTGQGLDTGVPAVEPNQLNIPSFAESGVTNSVTLTRTFRATRAGTWRVGYYLPGFKVTTSVPRVVAKRANDLVEVDFTFTRTTARLDAWAKGAITLSGPTAVRMPVAMRPVALDVPPLVEGDSATGSVEVPVSGGTTGTIDITASGLAQGDVYEGNEVPVGGYNLYCYAFVPGTTELGSIAVDAVDDSADLDLFVYGVDDCDTLDNLEEVGVSATGSADERVLLENPDRPFYVVEVDGFAAGADGANPIEYTDVIFDLGGSPDVGALTATPDPLPVTAGRDTSFDVSWTGLQPGFPYLGRLSYAGVADKTLVEVDVEAPPAG